jgi:hypothetical protein
MAVAEAAEKSVNPVRTLRSDATFSNEQIENGAGKRQHDDEEQPRQGDPCRQASNHDASAQGEHGQTMCQRGDRDGVIEELQN